MYGSIQRWQDEGGRGSKKSVFVHAQGITNVQAGGGVKMGKIVSM